MGMRSKVAILPAAVCAELDRLISTRGFSGYEALAEWLKSQGYRIEEKSDQRYSGRLQQQLAAVKLTGHLAEALTAERQSAFDSSDDLTALTVQLIRAHVVSVLRAHSAPHNSRDPASAGSEQAEGSSSGESATAPDAAAPEPAPISPADLVQLMRITADLGRITRDRQKRTGQASSRRQSKPTHWAKPKGKGLSEGAYRAICNALVPRN